jgi:hypothetical protein
VPQAAAAAVNHDADLPDAVDAHLVGCPGVEDLINHLAGVSCEPVYVLCVKRTAERA